MDGRKSIEELHAEYNKLANAGWQKELIYTQEKLPIYAYLSPLKSACKSADSLWILSGIHGEEPAGPNALAFAVDHLIDLATRGVPIVTIPLVNPLGYSRDDRFFDAHRNEGSSVTDAEEFLPSAENPNVPRVELDPNDLKRAYSRAVHKWTLKTITSRPPKVFVDHHEDELSSQEEVFIDSNFTYGYAYGNSKKLGAVCKLITTMLKDYGFPIQDSGKTRFNEEIINGFVWNNHDGSIDELLASPLYYLDGLKHKVPAQAGFVIETTRDDNAGIPLARRIAIHTAVIKLYETIWDLC